MKRIVACTLATLSVVVCSTVQAQTDLFSKIDSPIVGAWNLKRTIVVRQREIAPSKLSVIHEGTSPSLSFSGDGTVHGHSACSDFAGVFAIEQARNVNSGKIALTVKSLVETSAECPFFERVKQTRRYRIRKNGTRLSLLGRNSSRRTRERLTFLRPQALIGCEPNEILICTEFDVNSGAFVCTCTPNPPPSATPTPKLTPSYPQACKEDELLVCHSPLFVAANDVQQCVCYPRPPCDKDERRLCLPTSNSEEELDFCFCVAAPKATPEATPTPVVELTPGYS